MATYTSNLNLYMPDSTDDFGEFREEHNDNMVKIDNAIGGGGGSGGHTIIDQSGNTMPNRTGLQFIGASVTDDSVNNKTVVTVTGGGGGVHYSTTEQVIGTWIDGKPLYQKSVEIGTVNGGSGKNVAHGISDFKRLVGHECVGYNTAESAWNILSKVDNDASYQREFKVNATNITIGNSAHSQTFTDVVATIRYTKTTD